MAIVINFIANAGQYIRGVQDAINTTEIFSRKTADALRANAAEFAKWGAAASAAGAVGAAAMIASAANTADELKKLATFASLSTEELQRQAFAASKAGVDMDTYASTIKDMNDRVGDFVTAGAGPMVDFFEKIGPKVGVTADHFRDLSGPDALQLYVSSLEKANVSQAEMTFFMEALAGDSTALLPLLANNGEAMKAFANEADRLGLVLSDIDVEVLHQMSSSVDDLMRMFGAFSDQFSAEFAPVVQVVAELLKEAAVEAGGVGTAAESAFDKTIDAAVFVINAIDGIGRTFQLAGSFIAQTAAMVVHDVLWIAESIASGPIDALNDLIRIANLVLGINIPLAEQPEFVAGIRREMDLAKGVVEQASIDMQEILMRPMAGDAFRGMVDAAKKAAEESAQAAIDIKKEEIQQKKKLRDEESAIETEDQTKENERLAAKLASLRASFLTESEALTAKYAEQEELLRASLERQLITKQEYDALMSEAERAHGEAQKALVEKNEKDKTDIQEISLAARAQMMAGNLSQIAGAFGSHSKKMNKIAQIAGATSALISTYQGQAEALKLPFPANLAAAATVGAAGMGFVAAIKNAGNGGGGGGSSVGSGGGMQAAPPPNTFSVNVNGLNPGQLFSGSDIGNNLIGLINDRLRAGDRLVGINA